MSAPEASISDAARCHRPWRVSGGSSYRGGAFAEPLERPRYIARIEYSAVFHLRAAGLQPGRRRRRCHRSQSDTADTWGVFAGACRSPPVSASSFGPGQPAPHRLGGHVVPHVLIQAYNAIDDQPRTQSRVLHACAAGSSRPPTDTAAGSVIRFTGSGLTIPEVTGRVGRHRVAERSRTWLAHHGT
jgi:hypothetical protein